MKICRILSHLITPFAYLTLALAQADVGSGRIISLSLDSRTITTLQLRPGFVTSVRVPEPVSSVVLGDPGAFKAEHSEAEPQLVVFKPSTATPCHSNALITTRTGREVSLSLISRGSSDKSAPIDYVLRYEPPHGMLIAGSHPTFLIEENKSIDPARLPNGREEHVTDNSDDDALSAQRNAVPHWKGESLRVSIGTSAQDSDSVRVAFSVLNASPKTIELLPPQIELTDIAKEHREKGIKAEPVPIRSYRLTSRRLAPGERADGLVWFERPPFKESTEPLELQVTEAEQGARHVQGTDS